MELESGDKEEREWRESKKRTYSEKVEKESRMRKCGESENGEKVE